MTITFKQYTNIGGRGENEDSLFANCIAEKAVFVVADGLGGHRNGKVASKLVADTLGCELYDSELGRGAMTAAFRSALAAVQEAQKHPKNFGMKTTAVALAIKNNRAVWGHVGDSRLYYFSSSSLPFITSDHSVSYKKYLAGEITHDQIQKDEDRNNVLEAIGSPSCRAEICDNTATLSPGDAFLLCSDGFWEYIYTAEIETDCRKAKDTKEWLSLMFLRIKSRIKPYCDNISAIAVFID